MAKKHAIVRKLLSVETLGCTTIICSDKTGTLTTNEMSCVNFSIVGPDQKIRNYEVAGHSYRPIGAIRCASELDPLTKEPIAFTSIGNRDESLKALARIMTLCNYSRLVKDEDRYCREGEPTEAALRVLVEKMGCPEEELNRKYLQEDDRDVPDGFSRYWSRNIRILATLEFSRDRKSMSVLCDVGEEWAPRRYVQLVKGAPETILERSTRVMLDDGSMAPLTSDLRARLATRVEHMAAAALRTLAFAMRLDTGVLEGYSGPGHAAHELLANPDNFASLETDLVLVGLAGLIDPPRPEARRAIKECRRSGIRVYMITGDNKLTAEAISRSVGIVPASGSLKAVSFTGREFEALDDDSKRAALTAPGAIFSRTEPKHKQLVIRLLKDMGEVTAMTGDGVNDAPALKLADIGVAMGISGTEVCKEASDMVLADDNFATIVSAVEEGRSIYNNMKAFIRYLISSNIGEVASIFFTAALGIPEGLVPVQLLWVNLVTDGPPATALGFNPPDVDVMKKPPRGRSEPLITSWIFMRYLIIGLYVGVATVGIFVMWYLFGVDPQENNTPVSMWQLMNWSQCSRWEGFEATTMYDMDPSNPCTYFTAGKKKASTLSLTVLVVIEMLNALNALSEEGSLLQMPPWANPWLCLAILSSIVVHALVLYVPLLARIFNVVPLSARDWACVLLWSMPVIFIDEAMKAAARRRETHMRHRKHRIPASGTQLSELCGSQGGGGPPKKNV
eukprot:Polyplicarium_translucidae@DN1646_c0_g1_i1.p1